MLISEVPEQQWRQTQGLDSVVRKLKNRVDRILGGILDGLDSIDSPELGVDATRTDNGRLLAQLDTLSGAARIGWRLDVDEDRIVAVLYVQREQFDEYDRLWWQEVWELVIPSNGTLPYVICSDGTRKTPKFNSSPAATTDELGFVCAHCLTYRIISGPEA